MSCSTNLEGNNFIRHFTPRKVEDMLKMNDQDLKAHPEFKLATMEFFENEGSK